MMFLMPGLVNIDVLRRNQAQRPKATIRHLNLKQAPTFSRKLLISLHKLLFNTPKISK